MSRSLVLFFLASLVLPSVLSARPPTTLSATLQVKVQHPQRNINVVKTVRIQVDSSPPFVAFTIGRGPDNHVVLPVQYISRNHVRIGVRADGSIWLTDLGSTNGTLYGGARLKPHTPTRIKATDSFLAAGYTVSVGIKVGRSQ